MEVVAKNVRRFFALGRGFSSRMRAYLHLAKRELNDAANEHLPSDGDGFRKFYQEKFPLYPCGECPFASRCNCYAEVWVEDEDEGQLVEEDDIFPSGRLETRVVKSYCNQSRWKYLRERAKEMIESAGEK